MTKREILRTLTSDAFYGAASVASRVRSMDEVCRSVAMAWLISYGAGTWQAHAVALIEA